MNTNDSSLTMSQWLTKATKKLEESGIGTARLDALVLFEDATGKNRAWLLAHPETRLDKVARDPTSSRLLDEWVERRAGHEPLAYIRGRTEFYGRKFKVDKRVLEPRPESETMIDLLKTLPLPKTRHIIDVGTGSGSLGITAALEIPGSTIELIDIDPGCLKVARQNLKLHKVTAELVHGDLLEKTKRPADVVLANLPYVPDSHTINEAAMQEPKIAIFGGLDGLNLYRKLFTQFTKNSQQPKYVLTESLPFQHQELEKIAGSHKYKLHKEDDFIMVFKLRQA